MFSFSFAQLPPHSLVPGSECPPLMLRPSGILNIFLSLICRSLSPLCNPAHFSLYAPTLLRSTHTGLCGFGFGPECNSVVSRYLGWMKQELSFPSPHSSTYLTCHHIYTHTQTDTRQPNRGSHSTMGNSEEESGPSGQLRLRLCQDSPQNEGLGVCWSSTEASGVRDSSSALMQYSDPACVWFCSVTHRCKAVLSHHRPRWVTLSTPPLPLDILCSARGPRGWTHTQEHGPTRMRTKWENTHLNHLHTKYHNFQT